MSRPDACPYCGQYPDEYFVSGYWLRDLQELIDRFRIEVNLVGLHPMDQLALLKTLRQKKG